MRAESKLRIHVSQGGRALRGYFPVGGELPDDDDRVRAGVPLHGRNLFPDLPDFREATFGYMQALTGLGHRLMSCIGRGLRLGDTWFVDRYTDILEKLTQGRYPSAVHRVINHPQRSRVSMPFFFDPRFDAQLPVQGTYGDYLLDRFAKIYPEVGAPARG